MIYNILPGGNSILHNLHYSQAKLAKIYKLCHNDDKILYHMPFVQNVEGKSPLDMSLDLN